MKDAATIEYVARRMAELQKENAGITLRVKIEKHVPDRRKRNGHRTETVYGVVQFIAAPSSINGGHLMVNIEAKEVAFDEFAELTLRTGPTR